MDPQASDYPAWSPYNYVLDSPLVFLDPDGTTVYKDSSGTVLYDDGIDNGAEVTTTQAIIDENTDDEGNVDWEAVRTSEGSAFAIVDDAKYWDWAATVQNEIIAQYGSAAKVAVDNKGNVTVTVPPVRVKCWA